MTDAKEPSRMEQKLAETDRIGIIGLRNDLLSGGAFPPTVEHVIELLTSRTLTIYFFAEQCRKKEAEVATLTRERDEAREERDVAYDARRNADIYARRYEEQAMSAEAERDTLRTQLAAARELMAEAATDIGYLVNAEYHGPDDVHPAMRAKYTRDMEIVSRLTAAVTPEDE
jgi:hypothetical protein